MGWPIPLVALYMLSDSVLVKHPSLKHTHTHSRFLHKYLQSSGAIKNYLVGYTKPSSLPFLGVKSGSIRGGVLMNTMEHLACFYPGTLALGLINSLHPDQRTLAEGLTRSCYVAYNSTRTGLAADSFVFNTSPHGGGDYARAAVSVARVVNEIKSTC